MPRTYRRATTTEPKKRKSLSEIFGEAAIKAVGSDHPGEDVSSWSEDKFDKVLTTIEVEKGRKIRC